MRVKIIQVLCWLVSAALALPAAARSEPLSLAPPHPLPRTWLNLDRYSGEPGSATISPSDFRQLAFELQRWRAVAAREELSPAQREPYAHLVAPRGNMGGEVPLCVIRWDRSVERPAGGEPGLASAEPAVTNVRVLAFAPVVAKTFRGGALTLTLGADALLDERQPGSPALAALRLDAGDGAGWRDLGVGRPAEAAYAETGVKILRLEATQADGVTLSASATLEVAALSTPDPTEALPLGRATLFTYKSGAHAGYQRPVLVVEGFDLDNTMSWDALYDILNKEQLAETLRRFGRDLAVVDFADATTNIYVNAESVMEAVRVINANRADAADPFTVIGASMGGLVSRRALCRMEASPSLYGAHDVDTWISFDSPQEGANIPLGLQAFFGFFGGFADEYSDFAAALEFRRKLDTVAAQQMLLCHYRRDSALAGRSPEYASFETEMRAGGYPSACRRVAIANGSKAGLTHPFSPGELIVSWNHESFWVDLTSKSYALFDAPSPARAVFYGWFNPWDLFGVVDYETVQNRYFASSLDNAAGGTRGSFLELFETLPADMKDADDTCAYPDHCFIPTVSALGIPCEYLELPATNAAVLALSPFDEVHCAVTNEAHIDINASNKRWFVRAVLEGGDADADGFNDYQEFLMGTDYNAATSRLEVVAGLAADTALGEVTLAWQALPNVRYDVYQTSSLGQEWTRVETVNAAAAGTLLRRYPMDPLKPACFYKIAAAVVDPVAD